MNKNLISDNKENITIIHQKAMALNKLKSLGLTYGILHRTILNGYKQKLMKSKFAMPLDINLATLCGAVVELRNILCKQGWSIDDTCNFNQTISPNKNIILTISSGDFNTGTIRNVATKNKKGAFSHNAVLANQVIQLDILGHNKIIEQKYKLMKPHWFLLFFNNGNRIQMELSSPKHISSKNNKIDEWYERILLPPIDITNFNPKNDVLKNSNIPCNNTDMLDIQISRK